MDLNALNVRDFLEAAVERNHDRTLLIWEDTELTYGEFNADVDRAARAWHELGVRKGDRVAFMMANRPEFLSSWLGLAKIGGILVAINTAFKADEAGYLVQHSGAQLALVDGERAAVAAEVVKTSPQLKRVLCADPGTDFDLWSDLQRAAEASAPDVELQGDDVITLIYTSGTTGAPKGVMQTHKNYVMTGQSYPHWVRTTREDRGYMCLPLFHINAQAYQTMGAIGSESAIVLVPRFSATRFWDDVRRHKVTVWNFIGAMMLVLAKQDPGPQDRDHSIRVAYSGAGVSGLDAASRQALVDRYGIKLLSGFGMSETNFGCIEPYEAEPRPGSVGLPRQHPDPSVPRNEARIVREDGTDVEQGEVGELLFRNPAMMKGYYNDPERTAEAMRGGWLHTGDLSRQDEDGFFYFVDRKKDVIRRRGENISSVEVERILRAHQGVQDVAVVATAGDTPLDEEVLAFVVRRDDALTAQELWEWAAEHLAAFKVPRYIEFLDDLPRTGSNKVEKRRLRERSRSDAAHERTATAGT